MNFEFILTRNFRREVPLRGVTRVALTRSGWDDFDYRTTFGVAVSANGGSFREIGEWKILDTKSGKPTLGRKASTQLPSRFKALPARFIALAQDLESYRTLAQLGIGVAQATLRGLRDVAFSKPRVDPQKSPGFVESLVRFPVALDAFRRGASLLASLGVTRVSSTSVSERSLDFDFRCRWPGTSGAWTHQIDIGFSRDPERLDLQRMWAIAGNNGSGKTLLLGALARALSGLENADTFVSPRPTFEKIIAVSYSPWDRFSRPSGEGHRIRYIYCGLLRGGDSSRNPQLDMDSARRDAADDLDRISRQEGGGERWLEAMRSCGLDRSGSPLAEALEGSNFVDALNRSSAGEQLAAIVVTKLVLHVEKDALVLFDEPELHMHPSLLSALLRTLHKLLVERDAFAILATHSPIPLQEVPRHCVRVLDLMNTASITHQLDEQTFGASLGTVAANAFRARQDERNWAVLIRELRASGHTRSAITEALDGDPGLGVAMLLSALESNEAGA